METGCKVISRYLFGSLSDALAQITSNSAHDHDPHVWYPIFRNLTVEVWEQLLTVLTIYLYVYMNSHVIGLDSVLISCNGMSGHCQTVNNT